MVCQLQRPCHVSLLLEHQLLRVHVPAWPLAPTHVQVRTAKQVRPPQILPYVSRYMLKQSIVALLRLTHLLSQSRATGSDRRDGSGKTGPEPDSVALPPGGHSGPRQQPP